MRPYLAALFATGAPLSTLDPAALGSGVTLSGDKLTATFSFVTGDPYSARGTKSHSVGKFYFEVTAGGANGIYMSGICKSTDSANQGVNAMTNGVGWRSDGAVYVATALVATLNTYAVGDTIGVAVDLDNRKIWFRKGAAGNWNNSGANDPVAGVGGISFSGVTGAVFAVVEAQLIGTTTQKINTGQVPFLGVRPTGFNIWE
jgi:hypothetical protein